MNSKYMTTEERKGKMLKKLDKAQFFRKELGELGNPNTDGEVTVCCCFHNDTNPSMSVNLKKGVFYCHACTEGGDIFDFVMEKHKMEYEEALEYLERFAGIEIESHEIPTRKDLPPCPVDWRKPTYTYPYYDPDGKIAYFVLRWEKEGYSKTIRQSKGTGPQGWESKRGDAPLILYNLTWPEGGRLTVTQSNYVIVVEGENKAEALIRLGLCATCSPGGAGKWKGDFSKYVSGKSVFIFPDNDLPGKKHAEQVALSACAVTGMVKIVELPGLPEKGDIIDWLATKDGVDPQAIYQEICSLIEATPAWTPEQATSRAFRPLQVNLDDFSVEHYAKEYPSEFRYLLKPTFLKNEIGGIFGPPGVGKGIFSIQVGLDLAAGLPIFGSIWDVSGPARVLYLSAEDSKAVLHRRVYHALHLLPLDKREIAAANFRAVAVRGNVHLARADREELVRATDNLQDLDELLESFRPELVFLDTMSRFFGFNENDNPVMTAACTLLEERAEMFGCNILLLHHTNKTSGDRVGMKELNNSLSQTAIRGASALPGAIRWALNLVSLNQHAAKKLLGEQAEGKAPGTYVAMQVSMSNNGVTGYRRYFERRAQGLLFPVEPVANEKTENKDEDARILAEEVLRWGKEKKKPLSVTQCGKNLNWGKSGRGKNAAKRAAELELITLVIEKERFWYLYPPNPLSFRSLPTDNESCFE